jgi:hypothetical protein
MNFPSDRPGRTRKWDGYRAIPVKNGVRVSLLSRNQKDLTREGSGRYSGDGAGAELT